MKYIFDSDALTALSQKEEEDRHIILDFLSTLDDAEFCISILTVYEYEFGISGLKTEEEQDAERKILYEIIEDFEIIPLSIKGARIFGELKHGFKKKTGINKNALKRHNIDISLASTAIENNCVLISNDSIYSDHLQVVNTELQHQSWK